MRLLLALCLITLLGGCSRAAQEGAAQEGTTLEGLRGQWVVINYWAKWCKPCIEEIPELNRLNEAHADVSVLGVNYDGLTGEALAAQEQELGVGFPTVSDPAATLGSARPVVLPTSVIVDPEGAVYQTLVGPQTEKTLLEAIRGQSRGQ